MKTVGILGGMGPAATADFFDRMVKATAARRDQDHLHIIVDNQPAVPDRTAYLLGRGPDPAPTLIEMAQRLVRAGAELLVIPCNTANVFVERVARTVTVPVVRWADEVAISIRHDRRDIRRVGVLGSTGTLASGLYQHAFRRYGLQPVVPTPADQEKVMDAIYTGVKAGSADLLRWTSTVHRVGASLARNRADAVLFACTELSWLAGHDTSGELGNAQYLDAAQLVAERVVRLAGAELSQRDTAP